MYLSGLYLVIINFFKAIVLKYYPEPLPFPLNFSPKNWYLIYLESDGIQWQHTLKRQPLENDEFVHAKKSQIFCRGAFGFRCVHHCMFLSLQVRMSYITNIDDVRMQPAWLDMRAHAHALLDHNGCAIKQGSWHDRESGAQSFVLFRLQRFFC